MEVHSRPGGALEKTQTFLATLEPEFLPTQFNLYMEAAFWLEAENSHHHKRWSESRDPFKTKLAGGSFFREIPVVATWWQACTSPGQTGCSPRLPASHLHPIQWALPWLLRKTTEVLPSCTSLIAIRHAVFYKGKKERIIKPFNHFFDLMHTELICFKRELCALPCTQNFSDVKSHIIQRRFIVKRGSSVSLFKEKIYLAFLWVYESWVWIFFIV